MAQPLQDGLVHPPTTHTSLKVTNVVQLPIEILNLIFGHFICPPEDESIRAKYRENQQILASLCRTCKLFRDVAQPFLFTTYIRPELLGPNRTQRADPIFRSLLRSILHRRHLAASLKYLTLVAADSQRTLDGLGLPNRPCDPNIVTGASELLTRTPANMGILEGVQEGHEDAEDALLLSLAPNLSHLNLTMPFYFATDTVETHEFLIRSLFREAAACEDGRIHSFSSLKAVSLFLRDSSYLPLDMLFDVLCLPNLEELNVHGSAKDQGRSEQITSRPAKSSLKVMQLDCHSLVTLRVLVERCVKLDQLDVHLCGYLSNHQSTFQWPAVVEALQSQQSTLQHLALSADSYSTLGRYVVGTSRWAPVGSLTHFTSLRSLCIDSRALVGRTVPDDEPESVGADPALRYRSEIDLPNVLPPSLERLTFIGGNPTMLLWTLERLLHVLPEKLPLLKELAFDYLSGKRFVPTARGNGDIKERLSKLIDGYESAGVVWIWDHEEYRSEVLGR